MISHKQSCFGSSDMPSVSLPFFIISCLPVTNNLKPLYILDYCATTLFVLRTNRVLSSSSWRLCRLVRLCPLGHHRLCSCRWYSGCRWVSRLLVLVHEHKQVERERLVRVERNVHGGFRDRPHPSVVIKVCVVIVRPSSKYLSFIWLVVVVRLKLEKLLFY